MSKLVEELKEEHRQIIAHLDGAAASQSGGLHAGLRAAKKGLLAHLAKEDLRFYPAIEAAMAKDPRLAELVTRFRDEMAKVSEEVLSFYVELEGGLLGETFEARFAELSRRIRERIQREEELLYPEYDRLQGA